MLTTIPRIASVPTGAIVPTRTYAIARPDHVRTDADADVYVAGLLAGRTDVELVSAPVIGRDRQLRPVISVTVRPAGSVQMWPPVPVVTLL